MLVSRKALGISGLFLQSHRMTVSVVTRETAPLREASKETQTTKTQDYINEEWVSESCRVLPRPSNKDRRGRIVKSIHYWMISRTVGYPPATSPTRKSYS